MAKIKIVDGYVIRHGNGDRNTLFYFKSNGLKGHWVPVLGSYIKGNYYKQHVKQAVEKPLKKDKNYASFQYDPNRITPDTAHVVTIKNPKNVAVILDEVISEGGGYGNSKRSWYTYVSVLEKSPDDYILFIRELYLKVQESYGKN